MKKKIQRSAYIDKTYVSEQEFQCYKVMCVWNVYVCNKNQNETIKNMKKKKFFVSVEVEEIYRPLNKFLGKNYVLGEFVSHNFMWMYALSTLFIQNFT